MTFWDSCVASLKDSLTPDAIDTWIKPLQPHVDGSTLVLYAPNAYVHDEVRSAYLGHIKTVLPESISAVALRVGVRPRASDSDQQQPASPSRSLTKATAPKAEKNRALADRTRSLPATGQLIAPEEIWGDSHWAQSSDLVRTALFTSNTFGENQKRERRFSSVIFAQNNIKIMVTGEETNIADEDVFLQLLHYQRRYPLGKRIGFSLGELTADLGKAKNGDLNNRLVESIRRLQKTTIEVQRTTQGRVEGYSGQLINDVYYDKTEQTAHWSVTFNPEIARLFFPNFTRINRDQDRQLRTYLAKRLHRYYSSHNPPFAVGVEFLRGMTGSNIKDLRKFKQKLKGALDDLQAVGFLTSWEITTANLVKVVRGGESTSSRALP